MSYLLQGDKSIYLYYTYNLCQYFILCKSCVNPYIHVFCLQYKYIGVITFIFKIVFIIILKIQIAKRVDR